MLKEYDKFQEQKINCAFWSKESIFGPVKFCQILERSPVNNFEISQSLDTQYTYTPKMTPDISLAQYDSLCSGGKWENQNLYLHGAEYPIISNTSNGDR